MEEADLLKERLQAITDKRRIQQDIAKKRREIEEEKLKLQYIKKKALREQWLMDGLSQQSEEEQEAMRLQAQDEQQQSDQLQSNISRIEKEIQTLEAQELDISANEEVVLKRLKEVERTPEDIIKELNADFHTDVIHHTPSPLPVTPFVTPLTPAKSPPVCQPPDEEPKKATFAVEINVKHDKRTGKKEVVSTAPVSPETVQERGLKVYDDGRKTVYALGPDGSKMHSGKVGELTAGEVEELLQQATDGDVHTEVQYHLPVYSAAYTANSRPSTPRSPNKTHSPSPLLNIPSSRVHGPLNHELEEQPPHSKTPSPSFIHPDGVSGMAIPQGPTGNSIKMSDDKQAALISVKARSEGMSAPLQPVYKTINGHGPSVPGYAAEEDILMGRSVSSERNLSPNIVKTLPKELESEPITMIFMGYENADDDEEEDFQAEVVVIGNSEEEDDDGDEQAETKNQGECLYHPKGCTSKVFQPRVDVAQVAGLRDGMGDTYWNNSELHKPTFVHKAGKHRTELQGQAENVSRKGGINMEKLKLCSTER